MILTEKKFRHIVKRIIKESLEEMNLYHGTRADFKQFDIAYLSTGWGQQAYGYGFYLTDSFNTAKEYAVGGKVYTVEVPDKGYLTNRSVSMRDKQKIAYALFKYYTEENEDTRDSYPDEQTKRDFWEYEVKCILNSVDGSYVYGTVNSILGDDRETAEFLRRLGYIGLKIYQTELSDAGTTYVIFNQKDMKIIKKEDVSNG